MPENLCKCMERVWGQGLSCCSVVWGRLVSEGSCRVGVKQDHMMVSGKPSLSQPSSWLRRRLFLAHSGNEPSSSQVVRSCERFSQEGTL